MSKTKGGFTLPGEAGYEDLTLKMADKWGADVIRDSDGTQLSDKILNSGYGIYSTICIIRDHNDWAKKNMDKLQQSFLMAGPVIAHDDKVTIVLMCKYFDEQFRINESKDSIACWQVFDRTTNEEISQSDWHYDYEQKAVVVENICEFHEYTVNFLAYRIWEEISMYNHVTNNWNKEHLMPIDPRYPETRQFMKDWLDRWCIEHPATTVVRFTSLFYNFVWIWGSSERNRNLFTDWGSYDFTVSPLALSDFENEYGYRITSEDFINKGKFHVTHMPADRQKKDWMDFINSFVVDFGKELVDIVHKYGKKAYVFYDDSWIGLEPCGKRFQKFGFDGLIKCVFSGYEARLCAAAPVETHELRLHPYLFPIGLGNAPTFTVGGHPTHDAQEYWMHVRRALLREPIQRIGLGGYLHLTEQYPDFQNYIEQIADDFRVIEKCHISGKPYNTGIRVAVLHFWGKLRSWTLSGHFHETYMHDLIHINEALSGLPLDVDFISFEDAARIELKQYDVIINAGASGDAWSGGDSWKDENLVSKLYKWVCEGGTFIGVNEPSAVDGYTDFYRMAPVLGVDQDTGAKVCHGKWDFQLSDAKELLPDGCSIVKRENRFLTDGNAKVLMAHDGNPDLCVNSFGKGYGIYMGGFEFSLPNIRMLFNLILYGCGRNIGNELYVTDNIYTECAYFPDSSKLIIINNSSISQKTNIDTPKGVISVCIKGFEQKIIDI